MSIKYKTHILPIRSTSLEEFRRRNSTGS